ncbi:MAG: hypothetical protein QW692_00580 [Nitrososphaerota archaeon]
MSSSLEKFNLVEQKLKEIAESIEKVRQVSIAEPSPSEPFRSPRVFVWIREGEAKPITISGNVMRHVWRFEYIIDVASASPLTAYETVKEIAWQLYNKVMDDRTLGGLVLRADPAARFYRVEVPTERGYGHRWVMLVEVTVDA